MEKELQNFQIAKFALGADFDNISTQTIDQLKRHLLDSLGSLICAIPRPAIQKLVRQIKTLGENGPCIVPLFKGLPADRAAQLFTALIRYPDFMDNYLGKESTCHPSDNIGSLLAAACLCHTSGKDFLTAMAIAYEIECRLVEEIPVMKEGIDHTLLLSYSITAALCKMFKLTKEQTANALGMAGCSISPLATSRASYTSEWKGFASSLEAFNCMNIVLLAREGMTGPVALFEGPKGFTEVFDMKLEYDWSKGDFSLISKCVLKKYNAEVHSQSAIEAIIELSRNHKFAIEEIKKITITTFLTAYHIIGSGSYGDRKVVYSKEQADHSFFYLVAVALLDGQIYPEQFEKQRIQQKDVQDLLQKVHVETKLPFHKPVTLAGILDPYTNAYPAKMKAKAEILFNDGRTITQETDDYPGFHTRPFTWEQTIDKFKKLSQPIISSEKQNEMIDTIKQLEMRDLQQLLQQLAEINF